MRTITVAEFGGPVALMDLPTPRIGTDDVLIRVGAAGVNPFDWKVAEGVLRDEREHRFPLILASTPPGSSSESGRTLPGLPKATRCTGVCSDR